MSGNATKTILENGLTVILKEMHHAPVACLMVWYRVGSRNERPGITGISHWVEHLLFSGTPTFPGPECDRLISREGGFWNAFTWLDYTAFFETMPVDHIGLCLEIEADRMVNASMSGEEVEIERSIILSERAMYENDPRFLLNEELNSIAFRVHPYHHEVIGDEVDIRRLTREDLNSYYQRYYVPQNAVVVAVGDFESNKILAQIRKDFGSIPGGERIIEEVRIEPAQRGERRVMVHGPGDTPHLTVAYRAPAARHMDYLPLVLLNAIFTGGSSLGTFSGGGSNRSSRLYKALVDKNLAVAVSGSLSPTIDPFLYYVDVVASHGADPGDIEEALDDVIIKLMVDTISQMELDKALKRARAQFVIAGESITGQAHLLGLAEMVADSYRWYESILDRLALITLDDLDRVLKSYIKNTERCVGWYVPDLEQE
ncbi:MAG: pitrilysin family protein [Candidatus Promineifilaceae bacterium]|nr:pitrilysin family protein [Candidatus Promineifilaceae bacterium]